MSKLVYSRTMKKMKLEVSINNFLNLIQNYFLLYIKKLSLKSLSIISRIKSIISRIKSFIQITFIKSAIIVISWLLVLMSHHIFITILIKILSIVSNWFLNTFNPQIIHVSDIYNLLLQNVKEHIGFCNCINNIHKYNF